MTYILAYGFSVGLLLSLGVTLNLTYNPTLPFIIIAIWLGVFRLCISNRRRRFITLCIISGVSIVTIFILKYLGVWQSTIEEFSIYGEALSHYLLWGNYALATDYHNITLTIIGFIISLSIYIIGRGFSKFSWVTVIVIFYFLLCPIYDESYSSLGFLIVGISAVYNYIHKELLVQVKGKTPKYIPMLTYITLLIISISSFSFAQSMGHNHTQPMDWVNDLITSIEEWLRADEQVLTMSESPDLTKNPDLNQDIMMIVEADDLLYLRGTVYETFDGKGWTGGQAALEADNIEVDLYNWYLGEPTSARITYENLVTAKIYSPLNTKDIKIEAGDTVDYYTYYNPIPYDNIEFTKALRASDQETRLQSRGQMGGLVKEITESYSNAYDKVRAIEKYLAEHYIYSLQPRMPDEDHVDMVNYFLFTSKEGYCSHYASSMVLMVRKLGLKARYVTGFKLPYTVPEEFLLEGQMDYMEEVLLPASYFGMQSYTVRDEDAHAWPEVYFEGLGWVPFEPTQVYHEAFYASLVEDSALPVIQSSEANDNHEVKDTWYVYYLICFLAVVIVLSLPLVRRYFKRHNYKKLSLSHKLKWQYNYVMKALNLLYRKKCKEDTIYAYMIGASQAIYTQADLVSIGEVFEKQLYSLEELDIKDIEFVESQYRYLREGTKCYCKTIIYLWYIYVGKII